MVEDEENNLDEIRHDRRRTSDCPRQPAALRGRDRQDLRPAEGPRARVGQNREFGFIAWIDRQGGRDFPICGSRHRAVLEVLRIRWSLRLERMFTPTFWVSSVDSRD